MKLSLYENIIVDRDLPEYGLRRGYSVTLVDYVPHPKGGEEGAVLEVFDNLGESISVVTVPVSVINNETVKTTRPTVATVMIGSIAVDGFRLPDGSYRMSLEQMTEAVGRHPGKASYLFRTKNIKRLLGEAYTDYTPEVVKIELDTGERGQSQFINVLPLKVVTAYWVNQCFQGNEQALALVMALTAEGLERRFDAAFNVTLTESERDERLTQRSG